MKKFAFLGIWLGLIIISGLILRQKKTAVDNFTSPQPTIVDISPTPEPSPTPPKITIAAVGDIGLGRETNYQIIKRQNPYFPFLKVKDFLNSFDITIGNLEGPVIENCPVIRTGFKFCGRPVNIQGLATAGFDAVSLANNHINNYGIEGFQQTTANLKTRDIGYFFNDKIWLKKIGETEIGVLGFDDTVQRIKNHELQTMIEKANKDADIVAVNFHWGQEYKQKPNARQRELAEKAIDFGADIIIGHHPHVIQPLEYYKQKPIFYSLGNFVFDQMWSEATKTGAIGIITLQDKEIIDAELQKVYAETCCQPQLLK